MSGVEIGKDPRLTSKQRQDKGGNFVLYLPELALGPNTQVIQDKPNLNPVVWIL
jgi:hypothetical protein